MSDFLKQMGITDAFDESKADFSGMADKDQAQLYVSGVLHKAVIEVNEEGTEAAAASAVIMANRAMVMEPHIDEFRCNRPFIFFIHNTKDNSILFIGKYSKPN